MQRNYIIACVILEVEIARRLRDVAGANGIPADSKGALVAKLPELVVLANGNGVGLAKG